MTDQSRSIKLTFIILVWNSERYLQNCFDSIIRKCFESNILFEIVIIDNGSSDDPARIVHEYQQIHHDMFLLISLEKNRGTTYPRNLGMKQARGDYLCILDSDTELGDGCLADILSRLELELGIGIIAPRLLLPNGMVQNSVKHFPTMLNKILKIPRIIFGIRTRNADFYGDFPFSHEKEVDTAISACWFLRRELVDKIGFLDEKIFYSPEDIDYSLRVWKAGLSILYYPAFTVLHHTQQITHQNPLSRTSLSHFRGLLYYYWKHGGWVKRPHF